MTSRTLGGVAALLIGSGVAIGAVAAHALGARLEERYLDAFQTGADYQLWMGLGLLALAALQQKDTAKCARVAAWMILVGTILFSGSLYALALTWITPFAYVTPFGGVLLIAGWIVAGISIFRGGAADRTNQTDGTDRT